MGADGLDGFADFMRTRYAPLVRSAYLLVGDRGHAEDLVQTALAKTLGKWQTLRAPATAEAYTRTTMVRLAGRWGQRRWHGEVPTEHRPDQRGTLDRDPVEGLDLRTALGQLPWQQRAVLVLRYLDDLSETETATVLRCSRGTVKSRASRGLAALRESGLLDPMTTKEVDDVRDR